jgi:hypothetical protein
MFSITLALAQQLLMGIPSVVINAHESGRFDNACFAFAVSYSAPGRSQRHRRAVVSDVIRFPVARAGTCYREEHEIRSQFDRALGHRGSHHARTRYTAPVVYVYSRARTARRRRDLVIDRIEDRWRVVRFQFEYLPRIHQRDARRRWKNGRPGLERARERGTALPGRVDPRARVRIVRRGG